MLGTGEVEIAAVVTQGQLGLCTELQLLSGCFWSDAGVPCRLQLRRQFLQWQQQPRGPSQTSPSATSAG